MNRHDKIRNLAYTKWENAGRPENQSLKFWTEAEKQITLADQLIQDLQQDFDKQFIETCRSHYKYRFDELLKVSALCCHGTDIEGIAAYLTKTITCIEHNAHSYYNLRARHHDMSDAHAINCYHINRSNNTTNYILIATMEDLQNCYILQKVSSDLRYAVITEKDMVNHNYIVDIIKDLNQ